MKMQVYIKENVNVDKRVFNDNVSDTHGGGWSRKINARYLHTLMVYL